MLVAINDPYDTDPDVKPFVDKVVHKIFGKEYSTRRSSQYEDVVLGIDIFVIKAPNIEIATQLKTNQQSRAKIDKLEVHLNFQNAAGNDSGFAKYNEKSRIRLFIFIWPKMNYALAVNRKAMLNVWNKNNANWKRTHKVCYDGCFISLPLYEFIRALKGGYTEIFL